MLPQSHFKIPSVLLAAGLTLAICRAAPWVALVGTPYVRVEAGAIRPLTEAPTKVLALEGPPASQPLSLKAYTEELDRWLVAVNRLKDHPEAAARLRQQLPPAWVVLVDGQRSEVSTEWLRDGLEEIEKSSRVGPPLGAARPGQAPALQRRGVKPNRLQVRLEAMRRDARALAEASPPAWQSAHEKLREILARREFRGVHGPTWLDRQIERLNRWLADLLNRFSFRLGGHPTVTRVVLWAFLFIAAGSLLVWMARRLLQRPRDTLHLDIRVAPQVAATWQQMLHEARAAAGVGNFRDAIRHAYWAGIVRLEDLGLWTADRARTHREYLRLLSPGRPQREPLAALTHQFERTWYAGYPASAEDFQTVLSQVEKL